MMCGWGRDKLLFSGIQTKILTCCLNSTLGTGKVVIITRLQVIIMGSDMCDYQICLLRTIGCINSLKCMLVAPEDPLSHVRQTSYRYVDH